MSKQLSNSTITKKELYDLRQELRNKIKLHEAARIRILRLIEEKKQLKERVLILEAKDKEKDLIIETLKLQIEELRTMVFGKKKKQKETKR